MDHLLVHAGRRRVLVVDVCASADGHGIGYGIMLKRIERALNFGRAMRVPVFYIREARSINSAVFQLSGKDVQVLPRTGWQALWLRCAWVCTAPFRLGSPWLWTQRLVARTLIGTLYSAVERSRAIPRAIRRFILRPRPFYRRLRDANAAYAELSAERWQRTFKEQAGRQLHLAEEEGREMALDLSLPPQQEQEAIARAAALGIAPTDRLITVHVRESGYRSEAGLRQREWDALRNARIETYQHAFSALIERGYTVVRLGDPTMTPIGDSGVIDLATSPDQTEWLEAWCILRSEFLIGCDSGPSWLAVLLGIPVLTVNALHFRDVARATDRFICKLARERVTGRMLTISDMLTEDYLRTGLDTTRYEHVDNDPVDISEAALDMSDVVGGRERRSGAQCRFDERLAALGRQSSGEWSGLEGIAVSRHARGTLSRRFAEKYF